MEDFSKMIKKFTLPVEIHIQQYMRDHFFDGRAVLPAAESCRILALNVRDRISDANINNIYNASFDKFLEIKPGQDLIQALNEIEVYEDGAVISTLQSKIKSEKSGITRTNVHAVLEFRKQDGLRELTYDVASCLDGVCLKIASSEIYKHLIPFGPAYQNIVDNIYIASSGAVLYILAPFQQGVPLSEKAMPPLEAMPSLEEMPLGSPFVFDAALHAACVWSQRYYNTTVFPTGFERRVVLRPAIPGEKYFARIIPKNVESENYFFDIWIYDNEGKLREAGFGVKFRDVTAGRMKPPEWLPWKKENDSPFKNISSKCDGFTVVELETVSSFSERALSEEELRRLEPMKWKRRNSYISARLACKLLSRKLAGMSCLTPANEITTITADKYPACPLPDGSEPFKCSVSHDSRFAIAAASRLRIGIDVEEISDRILEVGRMFITDKEKELVNSPGFKKFDKKEAYLRIWTIKEAVTKALDIGLSESWNTAQVNHLGKDISTFILNGAEINAYHDTVDDHLFTLVVFE